MSMNLKNKWESQTDRKSHILHYSVSMNAPEKANWYEQSRPLVSKGWGMTELGRSGC